MKLYLNSILPNDRHMQGILNNENIQIGEIHILINIRVDRKAEMGDKGVTGQEF